MNKHEELIRKIAAEMAETEYKRKKEEQFCGVLSEYDYKYPLWDSMSEKTKYRLSDMQMIAAYIAVKHMAEEFKQSFYIWCQNQENMTKEDKEYLNSYLIERGLIPETEKEVEDGKS